MILEVPNIYLAALSYNLAVSGMNVSYIVLCSKSTVGA